jgi:hypothetical protein
MYIVSFSTQNHDDEATESIIYSVYPSFLRCHGYLAALLISKSDGPDATFSICQLCTWVNGDFILALSYIYI